MYSANEKKFAATIFSTIISVAIYGKRQYNESELLRWRSESVRFSANLLPSERLKWTALHYSLAKLIFEYQGYHFL